MLEFQTEGNIRQLLIQLSDVCQLTDFKFLAVWDKIPRVTANADPLESKSYLLVAVLWATVKND